jgi:hypothetical protein
MRVKANPGDQTAKLDQSFDLSMIGTYFARNGNFAKTAEYFEQVLAIRRQLWEDERKDTRARDRFFYALLACADARMRSGNPGGARALAREALERAQAELAISDNADLRRTVENARVELRWFEGGPEPPVK